MKFDTGTKPKGKPKYFIPAWKGFSQGDIVEMKGAFFMIHRINPLAKQMILLGIPDPRPKPKPEVKEDERQGDRKPKDLA